MKSVIPEIPNHPEMINRNMRCIEMSGGAVQSESAGGINRNMRCIEIFSGGLVSCFASGINRNMRCIEMAVPVAGLVLGQ